MKALLRAAALATFAAGCSLVMPSSDYFDDRGIETIGTSDNVQEIALAGSFLFAHDGTHLRRFPARDRVGSPVEIARSTRASGFHSLVATGGLAAWCDGDGSAFYVDGSGPAIEVPGGGPCGRVAVGRDALITLRPGQDESVLRRYVVSKKAFDPDLRLPGAGESAVIAATAEGSIVAATSAGILRECGPGDVGCEQGWCRLSAVDREIGSRGFYLTSGPAGGRPLLVTALSAILFAATTECCPFDDPTCPFDAVRSLRGSSSAESFAVKGGSVYALRQGWIARVWSFPDPGKDVHVAPASSSARLLTLGPEYAYFVEGAKIERAPLAADGPCGEGAKSCGGICVGVADPLYGCRADSCEPCAAWKSSLLVCRDGACALEQCRPSWSDCDRRFDNGCETDLLDPTSCGGCTTVCPEAESCSKRGCGACQGKEVGCNRRCVDLDTDPDNCGACGNVCPSGPGAVAKCKDRVCRVNCDEGFGDCDADPTNGCEPLASYYRDADGDGYGTGGKVGRGCAPPPGHAMRAGDCHDGDPRVHPDQSAFFPAGYVKDGAGIESFDYDCDGAETPAPDAVLGSCAGTVGCRAGAAPRGARGGTTNAYCGSVAEFRCALGPATCSTSPRSAVGCR